MLLFSQIRRIVYFGNNSRFLKKKLSENIQNSNLDARINGSESSTQRHFEVAKSEHANNSVIVASILNSDAIPDDELLLSAYVRCVHQGIQSGEYSTDVALELLDEAWKAQKRLWQLRRKI